MCYTVCYLCKDCGEHQETNFNHHCGLHKATPHLIPKYGRENLCWGHTGKRYENKSTVICTACQEVRKRKRDLNMELFGVDSEEERAVAEEEREMEVRGSWVSRLGKKDAIEDATQKNRELGLYDGLHRLRESGGSRHGSDAAPSGSGSGSGSGTGSGSTNGRRRGMWDPEPQRLKLVSTPRKK